MPKCPICKKEFDSVGALRDHHKAMHSKRPFVAPRSKLSRNLLVIVIIVLVAIGGSIGYLIYISRPLPTTNNCTLCGQQVSPAFYQNITDVSDSTLAAVAANSASSSDAVAPCIPPASSEYCPGPSVSPLNMSENGKSIPEILYIGAEFCPYCAAERWALVVALSKFGNFSNTSSNYLEFMQSASDDPPPNGLPTVSFVNAKYLSNYVAFVALEDEDRNHNPIATGQPNAQEQALWSGADASLPGGCCSFPFVDFGGEYVLTSAQYDYNELQGYNWTQVATQINNPTSKLALYIDESANEIITVICKIDGGLPSSVCSQSFAQISGVSYSLPRTSQSSFLAFIPSIEERPQTPKLRFL